MHAEPDLTAALRTVVDKIDASIRATGYQGEPIKMYVAGGIAVHYYTRARFTHDIDASFSHRLLLPYAKLTAEFVADGKPSILYFDSNYNPSFALMHPDHEQDAIEWKDLGNEGRIVKVFVLAPVDLAVSKVSRFSDQDRKDIQALAREGAIQLAPFRKRAEEALDYYIGNKANLLANLKDACEIIQRHGAKPREGYGPQAGI